MAYFSSDSVSVFPSTLRTKTFSGKYTSEQNFVNILNSITDIDDFTENKGYVLSYKNNVLKVVIHGYYFEITDSLLSTLSQGNLWLQIKVEKGIVNSNTLVSFDSTSVDLDTDLDPASDFVGLKYSTSEPADEVTENYAVYTLKAFENGRLVNKVRLTADSIKYDDNYNVKEEIARKQHNLVEGDGITISDIDTSTDTMTIGIEAEQFNKLNGLNRKGNNSKFVYFDDNGIAQASNVDAGHEFKIESKAGISYSVSRASYTTSGTLHSGVGVYASTNSPDRSIGENGDIWLKYTE